MKILKSTTIIPQNLYVERKADIQLRNVINDMGRPASILVSRQMGKTNLLLNAKSTLANENKLFIYIDLSSTFFPSVKECFRYIIDSAIDTNPIFEEIEEKITENREKNKLPNREHEQELLLLLRQVNGDIVIVLDEIDSMIKYDFSDQFFSQIRSVYFASRTNYPEFNRLTYVLSGVLEPSEIIHDKTKSPFNISEKIYLNDFTKEEYLSFIDKTKLSFLQDEIIEKIYDWTSGHPRITWDIVSKLEDKYIENKSISINDVDDIVDDLYIKHSDTPPIDNIKNLISENIALAQSILDIKQKIYLNISDAIKSKLYLFGIIEIVDNEAVTLKNKILEENLTDDFLTDIIYSQKSPFEIAQSFFNDGKYNEAIVAYERTLNSEKASETEKNISRINAGFCLLYLGNNKSALEFMNEVNISKEEDPYSYYINIGNKAVCYLNLKNYEESLKHCDILLEYKQPLFDIRAYYNKANLYSLYDYKNNKDSMLENINKGLSVISSYTAKDKSEQNEINNFLVNLHLLEYTYYMDDIEKSIEILQDILSYSSLEYKPNIYIELIKLNQKQYINEFFNLVRDEELQLNSFDPIKYNIYTIYEYIALVIIENEEILLKEFLNFCQNTYREHFSSKCNVLLNTGKYFYYSVKDKEQALSVFNQALLYQSGEEIFTECYKNIYSSLALFYYSNNTNMQLFFDKFKNYVEYIVSNELYLKLTYDDYFLLSQGANKLINKHKADEVKILIGLIDNIIENFDSENELFKTLFLDIKHHLCDEKESKLELSTLCINYCEKHRDNLSPFPDDFQKYVKYLENSHKQYVLMNAERKTFVRSEAKVNRNDLCPCNSGKKYKKCCGK
ncbi:MAG: AAA-like domain-containing protein [Sulfuricurvum sp.]|jgi:hypothetical protein